MVLVAKVMSKKFPFLVKSGPLFTVLQYIPSVLWDAMEFPTRLTFGVLRLFREKALLAYLLLAVGSPFEPKFRTLVSLPAGAARIGVRSLVSPANVALEMMLRKEPIREVYDAASGFAFWVDDQVDLSSQASSALTWYGS